MLVRPVRAGRLFALLCVVVLGAPQAFAQSFKSEEVDRSFSRKGQIAKRYAKDPSGDPEQKKEFEEYFQKYYFPAMTQHTDSALANLGKRRLDLFKQFIWIADRSSQDYLTDRAFEFASRVINSGRYHPAVTYNALLVLGQLDSQYTGPVSDTPTPHAEANTLLCKVARGTAKEARLPRFLLAGALVGLERHAKYLDKLPAANQETTTSTLLALMTAKELPGEFRDGVREWIYTQVARALVNLGPGEAQGKAFQAITGKIADESLDIGTRLQLASMLGEMRPEGALPGADQAAEALDSLAKTIAERERDFAETYENTQLRRGGSRDLGGGRGEEARRFVTVDRQIEMSRSAFLAPLKQLSDAIKVVAPMVEDPAKSRLNTIRSALDSAISTITDDDKSDLDIADEIKKSADRILVEGGDAEAAADDLDF